GVCRSGPSVPLVGELIERLVELALAPVLGRVRARGDRRTVLRLEVRTVVAGVLEGGDLQLLALECPPVDPLAEELPKVVLASPERRRLGAGRRRRGERSHRPEQGADHSLRGPAQ